MKSSTKKAFYPGRKQVFRQVADGHMVRDVIGRLDEALPGEPLLQPVMRRGQRLPAGRASLEAARSLARKQQQSLPPELKRLTPASAPFPVAFSEQLEKDRQSVLQQLGHA